MDPTLVQRFKFLNLVQQVARNDLETCMETIGLEGLTYKGPIPTIPGPGSNLHPAPAQNRRAGRRGYPHQEHPRQVRRARQTTYVEGFVEELPPEHNPQQQHALPHPHPQTQPQPQPAQPQAMGYPSQTNVVNQQHSHSVTQQQTVNHQPNGSGKAPPLPKDVVAAVVTMLKEAKSPAPVASKQASSAPSPSKGVVETEHHDQTQVAQNDPAKQNSHHQVSPHKKPVALDTVAIQHKPVLADAECSPMNASLSNRQSPAKRDPQVKVVTPSEAAAGKPSMKKSVSLENVIQPEPTEPRVKEITSILDKMIDDQSAIASRRLREARQLTEAVQAQDAAASAPVHQLDLVPDDAVPPEEQVTRDLILQRLMGEVERMVSTEEEVFHRHEAESSMEVPLPVVSSRKVKGIIPSPMIASIFQHKNEWKEYVAYNEQLWNTSKVSQYVFAERVTNDLLNDLISEVGAEVFSVLDNYVEGLAAHELS